MDNWFFIRFKSDSFNMKEVKDYFINPCCFGDDLGKWLVEKLKQQNVIFAGPDQEDWGWYLKGEINGRKHYLNFSLIEGDDEWQVFVEPVRSWGELFLFNGSRQRIPHCSVY